MASSVIKKERGYYIGTEETITFADFMSKALDKLMQYDISIHAFGMTRQGVTMMMFIGYKATTTRGILFGVPQIANVGRLFVSNRENNLDTHKMCELSNVNI